VNEKTIRELLDPRTVRASILNRRNYVFGDRGSIVRARAAEGPAYSAHRSASGST
jgi:hypothetical protein